MIRVEVLREDGRHKAVEAAPVLPGLCVHQSLKHKGCLTYTHVMSGLAVVDCAPRQAIRFKDALSAVDWTLPPSEIFDSEPHMAAVEEFVRMTNEYLTRSKKQEKRIAEETGGKVVPASGAAFGLKRDVVTPQFLVEAKTTSNKKYALSFKDFDFLTKQAYAKERLPCYAVEIDGKEEVIALNLADIDMSLLPGVETLHIYRKDKKSFTITPRVVRSVIEDKALVVIGPKQAILFISYRNFLEIAKKVVV